MEDHIVSCSLSEKEVIEDHIVSCSLSEKEVEDDSLSLNLLMSSDAMSGEKEMVPVVGMSFQSYDEARKFYMHYGLQKGFETKIKSSWCRKKTKEKYSALFTCSCEGFKESKEAAAYRRPDIRTGCKAHMRVKLLQPNKWEVISAHLDHNHECSPSLRRGCRSHKRVLSGSKTMRRTCGDSSPTKRKIDIKRRLEMNSDAAVLMIKPDNSFVTNAREPQDLPYREEEARNHFDNCKRLKLGEGDAEAMHKYFTCMQQKNSNFFYLMDLDKEGHLRNVFWADARSRTAYGYFGDVVTFDTTCLSNNYGMKFAPFVGVNHHGQSVLLGCSLLADESTETFVWVFQAWLTCMSGCAPNAIITDQCTTMHIAISKVFPRAHHRLCLWNIMRKIPDRLGKLGECKAIKKVMKNIVYDSLRIDDFEAGWTHMIKQFGLVDNEWLTALYKLRQQWVPVYLKDVFFAGMSTAQRKESVNSFFDGYMHEKTSVKEFVEKYDSTLSVQYEKEAQADFESSYIDPFLKTSCCFEGQIANLYTRRMFLKFQNEVYHMASCSKSLLRVDGSFITYSVKERVVGKTGKRLEPKVYEVIYNASEVKVRCICRLFEYKGILCKHALCVLNEFVDEIPSHYIISRWRKDFKREHLLDHASVNDGVRNPVQRYVALYKNAVQLVDEGVISEPRYKVVLEGLQELKKKVEKIKDTSCTVENNPSEHTTPTEIHDTTQSNITGCSQVLDTLQARCIDQPYQNRYSSCVVQSASQETPTFGNQHIAQGSIHLTGGFDPTSTLRIHNQILDASATLMTRDFGIHGIAQEGARH